MKREGKAGCDGSVLSGSRRGFLQGAAALAGVGFGRNLFAMPSGWMPPMEPNLAFGVISDTHLRTDRTGAKMDMKRWPDKYLAAALRHFRDLNVDAVVHCGDLADRGQVLEMKAHADAWRRVFPEDRSGDGRKVERLFVLGNHDIEGAGYGKSFRVDQIYPDPEERRKHILATDFAGWWERIWREPYRSVWHKTVKGYHFFGQDWNAGGKAEPALAALIDANREPCRLDEGDKPFFFLTHDITHGPFNRFINGYPNAFGFFGHYHQSATNWNTIHMLNGRTPSVQCPAVYPFFDDGRWLGGGDKGVAKAPLEGKLGAGQWRQGFVVRVYDEMLAISRHEYSEGGSLGADWVMPLAKGGEPHPFSSDALKRAIGEPQFRTDAKLNIEREKKTGAVELSIPPADGNPASRVYAFDVAVRCEGRETFRSVYASGANMGVGHAPDGGVTKLRILPEELQGKGPFSVAVTPFTSLGTRGRTLASFF